MVSYNYDLVLVKEAIEELPGNKNKGLVLLIQPTTMKKGSYTLVTRAHNQILEKKMADSLS